MTESTPIASHDGGQVQGPGYWWKVFIHLHQSRHALVLVQHSPKDGGKSLFGSQHPLATSTDWINANMVNPFDVQTIVPAKPAQHLGLIHFPIVRFMIGAGFDLLSREKRDSQPASAAYFEPIHYCGVCASCSWDGSASLTVCSWGQAAQRSITVAHQGSLSCRGVADCVVVGTLADAQSGTGIPSPDTAFLSNCSE